MKSNYINVIFPKEGAKISLLRGKTKKYVNDNTKLLNSYPQDFFEYFDKGVEVLDYIPKNRLDGKGKKFSIKFESNLDGSFALFLKSEDGLFSKKYITNKKYFSICNLFPNRKYFYFIEHVDTKLKTSTYSFDYIDRFQFIYAPFLRNARDIGGRETYDGKHIKCNLLYRGTELSLKPYDVIIEEENYRISKHGVNCHKSDLKVLRELGIKEELDVRGLREANGQNETPLKNKKYDAFFKRIVAFDCYQKALECKDKNYLKETFEEFAKADKHPIYMHCWGGADRTGTLCFLLEALLGAKMADLVIDYELTSFPLDSRRAKKYEPSSSWLSIRMFYLLVMELKKYRVGDMNIQQTVENFLISEVKVSKETIQKIKDIFLY